MINEIYKSLAILIKKKKTQITNIRTGSSFINTDLIDIKRIVKKYKRFYTIMFGHLDQELAEFSCEEPDNKYFKHYWPCGLFKYSTLTL